MYSRSANLVAVSVVLGILATIAVCLRYVARYMKGLRIWLDDHLVLIALVLSWGVCICIIVGASTARFGDHEIFSTSGPNQGRPLPELMILYGKICFACRLLHATAMQLLKIAMLLFYRRIFEADKRFRAAFWAMLTYVSLWWLVCFWLNLFTCYPVSWAWSPAKDMAKHCIPNYHAFFAYAALTNVISDALIAVMPLPFLWTVRMCIVKKFAITGMLLTGCVVIVAGIGRTYAFFTVGHSFDYTYENYEYLIWSSVEPCVGVIGCCLPTFKPLFTRNHGGSTSKYSARYGGHASGSRRTPRHVGSMEAGLTDDWTADKAAETPFKWQSLSEAASPSEEHEIPDYGRPMVRYNVTARLDVPHEEAGPLNREPAQELAGYRLQDVAGISSTR